MPLMAYEQPLLTIVPAVKPVKARGCECRKNCTQACSQSADRISRVSTL